MSRVRVRFEPRDGWVGVYVDTEARRAYVCLLPFLPIVVDYARPWRPVSASTRRALRLHLADRHAALTHRDSWYRDLVDLHDHEHDGPGTIRLHLRDDRSYDLMRARRHLAEAGYVE